MSARVEQRVEIGRTHIGQLRRVRQRLLRLGVGREAAGRLGLGVGLVALGIQRRLAAGRQASVTRAPASTNT